MSLKLLVGMTLIFLGGGAWGNEIDVIDALVNPVLATTPVDPVVISAAAAASPQIVSNQGNCNKAIGIYNGLMTKANESAATASTWCMAESPKIHAGMLLVNGALSGVSIMKNMTDACSKFNKAVQLGQAAMTAYSATCTAVKYLCESNTSAAMTKLIEAKGACSTFVETSAKIKSAETLLGQMIATCNAYKLTLGSAVAGITSLLQQSGMMGKCEKALTIANCATDPTNPQCPQPLDCTKAANAQNANCICLANPNSLGCPGAVASNSVAPTFGTGSSSSRLATDKIDPGQYDGTGGADTNLISPSSGSTPSGGSLGALSPGGGGSGGSGIGTGAGDKPKADQKKGLNANILSGIDGGGGGGGFGGSRSNSAGNSALKAYMPGGAKDPSRNLASQTFGNGEVTAAGSKSNWEKVRERYVENKSSLMSP